MKGKIFRGHQQQSNVGGTVLNPQVRIAKGLIELLKWKYMDIISDYVGDDGQLPAERQKVDAGDSHFTDCIERLTLQ